MTGSQETCLQVFTQHREEDKIPEVHPQLCHLLECHFKYLSPSFYTCEKGEHSHYRCLLMVVVTSGNTKGQLTLIEHLLYTSHSDKCLPVSASWRSLWMGLLARQGWQGVALTRDTKWKVSLPSWGDKVAELPIRTVKSFSTGCPKSHPQAARIRLAGSNPTPFQGRCQNAALQQGGCSCLLWARLVSRAGHRAACGLLERSQGMFLSAKI